MMAKARVGLVRGSESGASERRAGQAFFLHAGRRAGLVGGEGTGFSL